MEFGNALVFIICGFFVWLIIAPRSQATNYSDWFLAYMAALLFCLIGSSEIMMVKPVAFFFTIGGVIAFSYVVARSMIVIRIKK